MRYNLNSGYGQILMNQIAASVGPVMGKILFVVEDSDPAVIRDTMRDLVSYDPDGKARFFETLEAAYAACTTNANDVIVLSANTTHAVSTGIAWTKSRIHVIGMDGGDRLIQQGAKVQLSGAVDSAYLLKVTGVRNTFKNIKFIQASTHANALHCLEEGGEGSLYKNCTFTFGAVDNLDQTTANEVVAGSDSATYINCEFGTETLLTSAARTVFKIDQVTASQEFKSNRIIDCNFVISSSSTTATLLKVDAATDVLFSNNIKNCTFVASIDSAGGAALAVAVKSVASLVKGTVNFANCSAYGCTNLMSDAVGNDGFYTYGAVSTGTGLVGILGTAA